MAVAMAVVASEAPGHRGFRRYQRQQLLQAGEQMQAALAGADPADLTKVYGDVLVDTVGRIILTATPRDELTD